MIDVADPGETLRRPYGDGLARVDGILSGQAAHRGRGTGLYIDSLLSGRTFAAFSSTLRGGAGRTGPAGGAVLEELARVRRPPRASTPTTQAHRPGPEVFRSTGRISPARPGDPCLPRYDALTIGLTFRERADLCRIDRRVDQMARTAWRRRCGGCSSDTPDVLYAGHWL
ncbi:MAG: hypothetical protein ACLS63_07565 [Flavonifractor plautii]